METVNYLGTARKRLPILIGVPVLAAIVATLVVLLSPQKYAVTTYVAAPALIGGVAAQQFSGQQAANQFVAAFSAAATSPKVVDQVAAETGVDADDLRDGVEVKQVGASSQLTLTFTGSDQAKVAPVATAMTGRALTFLFASQVDVATKQVAAAEADVTAATKKISEWETANKVTQPDKLFQATLAEQSDFRRQLLEMSAVGNTKGANAAKGAIEDNQKRLNELGPKLPGYQALVAQRDASTNVLSDAQKGLQAARAQVGACGRPQVGVQHRRGGRRLQGRHAGQDGAAGGRGRPAHRGPADRAPGDRAAPVVPF
jgi:capsular polysaccharide biosynthesis protein